MRLEQLFCQLDHFLAGTTPWDRRAAIDTLLDILRIFSRNDIKTEILKELDRHASKFTQISKKQRVDNDALRDILGELNAISNQLYQTSGKIAISTMQCNLIQDISQRSTIPGGTCSFDLPAFHYWLQQKNNIQHQDLLIWMQPFIYLRKAIDLILDFIRRSSMPSAKTAKNGFFQATLNSSLPYQLLRVGIDQAQPCFAEISGSKHRYSIRFMVLPEDDGRPSQSKEDISFKLTCCLF